MICPEHQKRMVRKRNHYSSGFTWRCSVEGCSWSASEHPSGSLSGTLADGPTKELRIKAHRTCEKIWGKYEDREARKAMYDWLRGNTIEGHIGLMDRRSLNELIEKLERMINENQVHIGSFPVSSTGVSSGYKPGPR